MRLSSFGVRIVYLLFFVSAASTYSFCQVAAMPAQFSTSTSSPVPLSHLYWHFLMYQHHLDQKADQLEKDGQSGAVVRSFIQSKLNMSDISYEPIHRAADRLSASMVDLNARVQHIRSFYKESKPSTDGSLTPAQQKLHDQLKEFNDEREEMLTEQMYKLDNELYANDRATLREYLTKQVAQSVIRIQIPKPSPNLTSSTPVSTSSVGGK